MDKKRQELEYYWNEIKPCLDGLREEAGEVLYYIFQAPYQWQPKLLIVGINPGGDYEDKGRLEQYRKGTSEPYNEYTDEFNNNKTPSAGFNRNLCAIFGWNKDGKIDKDYTDLFAILQNAVGINNCFFNSGSVQKMKNLSKDVYDKIVRECPKITRTLVDNYIQPKCILALGRSPFNNLRDKDKQVVHPDNAPKNITIDKSFRGDIPVYYIPNPSRLCRGKYYKPAQIESYRKYLKDCLIGGNN